MPLPLLAVVAIKVAIVAVKAIKVAKVAKVLVLAAKAAKGLGLLALKFGKIKVGAKLLFYRMMGMFTPLAAMLRNLPNYLTRFGNFISQKFMALKNALGTFPSRIGQWIQRRFDPVDAVNGCMLLEATDIELPGPIPLSWKRTWYSDSEIIGHLGHGMRCSFEMELNVLEEDDVIGVFLEDGRVAAFPCLEICDENFNHQEGLLLKRKKDHYSLFSPGSRLSYLFYPGNTGQTKYPLTAIENEQGRRISLEYDEAGALSRITDSAGRLLRVDTNRDGRITEVALDQPTGRHVLVQYRYNEAQDMTEIIDSAGQSTHLIYQNHLIVQKTDRNQHSFYWKYDGSGPGARVTETWGDGGVLSGKIKYHDDERYNEVTDSLGNTIEYHYNEDKICTKIVYADSSQTTEAFNERFELISQTDEEGRITSYSYDDWSQVTKITSPDGSEVLFEYDDDGRLISVTNPAGAERQWLYSDDGTLQSSIDEAGAETSYLYNENKLVEAVSNSRGDTIRLEYDKHQNLSRVTLPDGTTSSWEYDYRGNCLSETNPLGAVQKFQYDELNRLVRANLADGNEVLLSYNAYDDVIRAKDKQTEVSYEYTALGSIRSWKQGGRKIELTYDTEEQLVAITNENGEEYRFERDIKGNISKEAGYDGIIREYERDLSGLVQRINRPAGRWTVKWSACQDFF